MDDGQIIALFWARAEAAVEETAKKYQRYCHAIAWNILRNHEDCEECVADTWMQAWARIPPQRPDDLKAFLGTITRHLSLKRLRSASAEKRGGGQVPLVLEELAECLPAREQPEEAADALALAAVLNRFLAGLPVEKRKVFVQRYWYLRSVKEIAGDLGVGESRVKMTLLRARNALRKMLEEEGVTL